MKEHDLKKFNKQAMLALKSFYDEDVCDEENIIEWHKSGEAKDLRKVVGPFVTWLE